MKKKTAILGLMAAMLLGSCSDEELVSSQSNEILKGINVTIEDAQFGADATRASYTVDPSRGFISTWTLGDTIGIYPLGGDQVAFPISKGEGSATATFDGGAWALRGNVSYSAYYPFSKANSWVSEKKIPVTYLGQEQEGNDNTAGLASYDYLASAATQPAVDGTVNLTMKHLGAFVRFQLTMPEAVTLTSAHVASSGTEFVTTGTVDLSAATPAIQAKTTAPSFDIALTGITCAKDQVVTLYAMVAPANLSGSELSIRLTSAGKYYLFKCGGVNFTAGKSYSFTVTETSAPDDDEPIITYDHAVDLGLPSGLKWADMNIGATSREDYGSYFAWGETEEKYSYNSDYSNYKYYQSETSKDADGFDVTVMGFTKYVRSGDASMRGFKGFYDNKMTLDPEDDAAHVNWGGSWRMPTYDEMEELRTKCTWVWVSLNGKNGYKVTGPNGKWIFLPAAGHRDGSLLYSAGLYGYYWSSSLGESDSYYACGVHFYSTNVDRANFYRDYGRSVRPVCSE